MMYSRRCGSCVVVAGVWEAETSDNWTWKVQWVRKGIERHEGRTDKEGE